MFIYRQDSIVKTCFLTGFEDFQQEIVFHTVQIEFPKISPTLVRSQKWLNNAVKGVSVCECMCEPGATLW